MSPSQPVNPLSPPPVPPDSTGSSGVRRHHTITATTARPPRQRTIEEDQGWQDDEVVDQDWVGGVGAVGESNLHRQASLPTRYAGRPIRPSQQAPRTPGSLTPRTLNSLTAITGHEGDEEEWEHEMNHLRPEDEHLHLDQQSQSSQSPLSPHFGTSHIPSPPPAESGVRRHQSLNHAAKRATSSNLRRAGTLQGVAPRGQVQPQAPEQPTEEQYVDEYVPEEDYQYQAQQQQQQYPASPIRPNNWNQSNNEWLGPANNGGINSIDDVQRALSALEINQNQLMNNNYQGQAPRFDQQTQQQQLQQLQQMQMQIRIQQQNILNSANANGASQKLPQLVTNLPGQSQVASNATYLPPIGQQPTRGARDQNSGEQRPLTASGAWEQKEQVLRGRSSNPNLSYSAGYTQNSAPAVPPIPAQWQNQQQGAASAPRLGVVTGFGKGGLAQGAAPLPIGEAAAAVPGAMPTPVDVPGLIAQKGYNPTNFDIRPASARYFVIKSYTEDDVHKSLKYEIWSSTDPGNKRLDKAFKETGGRGPIYLFFSVNASGHFCGMAQMLTPVDYTQSSNVWASDKWKGVFKVRWIFVRDVPNANLRHIRLNNTQERKPVTNSRDTQELMPEAGQEMLRIFFTHPARTSLLQDFHFYELQSLQKQQVPETSRQPSPQPPDLPSQGRSQAGSGPNSSQQQQQAMPQQPFVMPSPNMGYTSPHMQPMPQMAQLMQMQMNQQYGMPAAMGNVMRGPSPVPMGTNPGYMEGYGQR